MNKERYMKRTQTPLIVATLLIALALITRVSCAFDNSATKH